MGAVPAPDSPGRQQMPRSSFTLSTDVVPRISEIETSSARIEQEIARLQSLKGTVASRREQQLPFAEVDLGELASTSNQAENPATKQERRKSLSTTATQDVLQQYETMDQLVDRIMQENHDTAALSIDVDMDRVVSKDNNGDPASRDLTEAYPFLRELLQRPRQDDVHVYRAILLERREVLERRLRLTDEYMHRYRVGRREIKKIERHEAKQRAKETAKMMSANLRRSNRLGGSGGKTRSSYGDAVTDAELVDIIAQLEAAEERAERNLCRVPEMLQSERDKVDKLFINDGNRLVVNPEQYYEEAAVMRPWEPHEVELFKELYTRHSKKFHIISTHMPYRTTAECIRFYYNNKFDLALRKTGGDKGKSRKGPRNVATRKQNALKASLMSHDHGTIHPEKLPATARSPQALRGNSASGYFADTVPSAVVGATAVLLDNGSPISSESRRRRTETRDRLPYSKAGDGAEYSDGDYAAPGTPSTRGPPAAGAASASAAAAAAAAANTTPREIARWSEEDKRRGIEAFNRYGKDYKRVAELVGTKTEEQCKNFFSNNRRSIVLPDDRKGRNAGKRKAGPEDGDSMHGIAVITDELVEGYDARGIDTTPKRRRNMDKNLMRDPSLDELDSSMPSGASTPIKANMSAVTPRSTRKPKRPDGDKTAASDDRSKKVNSYWSKQEEQEFLVRLAEYGPQFEAIAAHLEDKSAQQVKNYWKRHKATLGLDKFDYRQTPGSSPATTAASSHNSSKSAGSIHALLAADDASQPASRSSMLGSSPSHALMTQSRYHTPLSTRLELPPMPAAPLPAPHGAHAPPPPVNPGASIASFLQPSQQGQPPTQQGQEVATTPPARGGVPPHYYPSHHPNAPPPPPPPNYPYTSPYYNQYSAYPNDYRYGFQSLPAGSSGPRLYPYAGNMLPAFASMRNYQPPGYYSAAPGPSAGPPPPPPPPPSSDVNYRAPPLILPNPHTSSGGMSIVASSPAQTPGIERAEPSPTTMPVLPPILPASGGAGAGVYQYNEQTILPPLKNYPGPRSGPPPPPPTTTTAGQEPSLPPAGSMPSGYTGKPSPQSYGTLAGNSASAAPRQSNSSRTAGPSQQRQHPSPIEHELSHVSPGMPPAPYPHGGSSSYPLPPAPYPQVPPGQSAGRQHPPPPPTHPYIAPAPYGHSQQHHKPPPPPSPVTTHASTSSHMSAHNYHHSHQRMPMPPMPSSMSPYHHPAAPPPPNIMPAPRSTNYMPPTSGPSPTLSANSLPGNSTNQPGATASHRASSSRSSTPSSSLTPGPAPYAQQPLPPQPQQQPPSSVDVDPAQVTLPSLANSFPPMADNAPKDL
ncbi:DNA-binding protein snt1 [Sorochytrium milnesiophthora]